MIRRSVRTVLSGLALAIALFSLQAAAAAEPPRVTYHTVKVDGVNIFYREAGSPRNPTVVLLHGYPSSSHMFRELIPQLAGEYHVIAPDYPGFGYSDAPPAEQFAYTFDHLASIVDHFLDGQKIERYSIYIQDYGSPIGFRLFTMHPDRIQAIITQNGNAYDEGLGAFWGEYLIPYWKDRNPQTEAKVRSILSLDVTKLQYSAGFRSPENVSPDSYNFDQATLDRPGNAAIQLALFYDYRNNLPLYPAWHKLLHEKQPPVLVVWGKNDPIFIQPGALAFQKDVPNAEIHLLNTGHFALEEDGALIAQLMRQFLAAHVSR